MGRETLLRSPKVPLFSFGDRQIEPNMKKQHDNKESDTKIQSDKIESDKKRTRVNFFDEVLHIPFTDMASSTGSAGDWARGQQLEELKHRAYITETSVYLNGKRTSEVERIINQHHETIKILKDALKKQADQIDYLTGAMETIKIKNEWKEDGDGVPGVPNEKLIKDGTSYAPAVHPIAKAVMEGNSTHNKIEKEPSDGIDSAQKTFNVANKASFKVSDKKTLKNLKKAQLQELCVENGIDFVHQDTKDKLISKLTN